MWIGGPVSGTGVRPAEAQAGNIHGLVSCQCKSPSINPLRRSIPEHGQAGRADERVVRPSPDTSARQVGRQRPPDQHRMHRASSPFLHKMQLESGQFIAGMRNPI